MKKTLLLFLIAILFSGLNAEGTKQASPTSNDVAMLLLNDDAFGDFGSYIATKFNRLYFTIKNPGSEQVYIGLSQRASVANTTDGQLGTGSSYWFRVKNSSGVIIHGPIQVTSANANTNNWALASAGPSAIVGASGYASPTGFRIPSTSLVSAGDYYIEFSSSQTTNTTGNDPVSGSATNNIAIKFWDITVATTTVTPSAFIGRVWAYNWVLRTPKDFAAAGNGGFTDQWNRPFNGAFFVFSDNDVDGSLSGFVSRINFLNAGFRGLSFAVGFNSTGPVSTGTVETNRRSLENINSINPEYPVFFNNPDPTIWVDRALGQITTNPVVNNCGQNISDVVLQTNVPRGQIEVLLDFNNNGLYDFDTADRILSVQYQQTGPPPYSISIPWDLKNGLGANVPQNSIINIITKLQQGVYHFPMYDVERLSAGFTIQEIRPAAGNFTGSLFFDDSNLISGNAAPVPSANKVNLNGCAAPCHTWTGFNPNLPNTVGYGNLNTVNSWWVSNRFSVASTLNQVCAVLLPIELVSFHGEKLENSIELNWITASETNNDYFDILRSENGIDFYSIGHVIGQGNTTTFTNYEFFDDVLPNTIDGIMYYQLNQFDFDGASSFSQVVALQTEKIGKLSLIQNPIFDHTLNLFIPTNFIDKSTSFEVYNTIGQVVHVQKIFFRHEGTHSLNMDHSLSSGLYFLKITTNTEQQTIPFILN